MAERSAAVPQSLDDDAVADLVRELQVAGRLGVLNVSDVIVPMYLLGQRQPLDITVVPPVYLSSEVFSAGMLVAPAAATVLADTAALTIGDYDFIVDNACGGPVWYQIQHRDAANAANVNEWGVVVNASAYRLPLSLTLANNERLRVLNLAAVAAGVGAQVAILAQKR